MAANCQRCKKRHSTVHVTDVAKDTGEKRELHLCDVCADELGIIQKQQKTLDEVLNQFIQVQAGLAEQISEECPHCGINWMIFRQTGLLGCPHDYQVFSERLLPLLERAHNGASQHVGKVPQRVDSGPRAATTLLRLRRELAAAVEAEEYKKAANLRDQIQGMEKEMAVQGDSPAPAGNEGGEAKS